MHMRFLEFESSVTVPPVTESDDLPLRGNVSLFSRDRKPQLKTPLEISWISRPPETFSVFFRQTTLSFQISETISPILSSERRKTGRTDGCDFFRCSQI